MNPIECPDCVDPPDPPPALDPDAQPPPYLVGHVCTIFESLATPAELILRDSPGIKDNPALLKRCEDALAAIQKEGSRVGKNRPCIIVDSISTATLADTDTDTNGVGLLLLGTFDRTPYHLLPRLYRFFLVAVPPNPASGLHFHLVPPWTNNSQWVVAFVFRSTRPLKGLWPRARIDSRGPDGRIVSSPRADRVGSKPIYRATPATRGIMTDTCRSFLARWSGECLEDPSSAVESEEEYRESRFKPKECSDSQPPSRRNLMDTCTSRKSGRSGRSGRSRRMRSRCATPLSTLPEEGKASAPSNAGGRKSEGKGSVAASTPPCSRPPSLKGKGTKPSTPSHLSVKKKGSFWKLGVQLT